MAISPTELAQLRRQRHDFSALEREIDHALLKASPFDGTFTISINKVSALDQDLREELMLRYIAKGWAVKYTSDQRDGDLLHFTPALESRPA